MHLTSFARLALCAMLSTAFPLCSQSSSVATMASGEGKIPITTKSDEARNEFLLGRDLSDRLQPQESLQHFDKAIALDPDFATAELSRAGSSPTRKEFFQHLERAVSMADKVSDGERLAILATQAGANGDTAKRKELWEKLVAAYPNDERAQFNLAAFFSAQQQTSAALEHYKKAAELAPNFSGTYNAMGYAYRQIEDYANAELAFKKYAELIPSDPNPYDSYGELLLKMGRFDESIAQYRKALSRNSHFPSAHIGIAADLLYQGKTEEAAAELQTAAQEARNDGELRGALFGLAVIEEDSDKPEKALAEIDKEFAVAQKRNDVVNMAADLQIKGDILAHVAKYPEALKQYDQAYQMIEGSGQSAQFKNTARLQHLFQEAEIAIGMKDYAAAKTKADKFQKEAEGLNSTLQRLQAHELMGRLALAQKDYTKAVAELAHADQQDPENLMRLAEAYRGKGDAAKANQLCAKAARFNSLPQMNYAFVRAKAQKMVLAKKG